MDIVKSADGNKRIKYWLAYFAVILLVTAFFAALGIRDFKEIVEYEEEDCLNSIHAVEKLVITQHENIERLFESNSKVNIIFSTHSLAQVFETEEKKAESITDEIHQGVLDKYNNAYDEYGYSFAMLLPDGKFLTSPGKAFPVFTEEQINEFYQGNALIIDGCGYSGCNTEGFLLISMASLDYDTFDLARDAIELSASDIFVYNPETGVVKTKNSDIVEESISELDYVVDDVDDSGYRKGHFKVKNGKYSGLSKYCRFIEYDLEDGLTVCAHYSLSYVLDDVFSCFLIPFVLALLFVIVTLSSCIKLSDEWKNNNLRGVQIKLFGIIRINGSLSARVASMLGVCSLIALTISSFFIFLPSITNLYVQSDQILETVSRYIPFYKEKKAEFRNYYEENMMTIMTWLDSDLKKENGVIDTDYFKQFAKIIHADSITVFDAEGNIEYDSKSFTPGYKLSSDPEDKEYELWKLLKGEPGKKVIYCDDDFEKIYFAKSRSDKAGIIRVTMVDPLISNLAKAFSEEAAIKSAPFITATMLVLGKTDDTSHLTCYNPATEKFSENSISFADNVFVDGYNGTVAVHGKVSHVLTKVNGDDVYILLDSSYGGLIKQCLIIVFDMFLLYLILSMIIIRVAGLRNVSSESEALIDNSPATEGMLKFLDKTITKFFSCCLIAVIFLILLDSYLMQSSANIKYWLVSNNNKGFTIYTIGYSFFAIVLSFIATKVIRKVAQLFCRCIPSKKVTFCQLLSSLIQLVIIVMAVVSCLKQFGITTVQMLAFLSISGVALGLGAKDIVTDFIAGIFIILDRNINIGDFIEVDGFFGKVVEINIRTTKVQRYNRIVSINNSNMRNVINNSAGLALSYVNVLISYRNKIDDFIDLVNKSADRYLEADERHILDKPPKCYGITAYEKDGARISIAVLVKVEKKFAAELLLNTVTKRLMEENNIILPKHLSDYD